MMGFGALALALGPVMAYAQVQADCDIVKTNSGTNLQFIICRISELLNTIVPILIILGVIFFIYGVITYVISNDEEAKSRGRDLMIYGLIGLLVIVSMWGLVAILKNTFGISGTTTINVPCIPSPGVTC